MNNRETHPAIFADRRDGLWVAIDPATNETVGEGAILAEAEAGARRQGATGGLFMGAGCF